MILEHTLLDAKQEQSLISRVQCGDTEAQEILLANNERLIYKIAIRYVNNAARDIELEDLMQEGRIGLLYAAHKYSFAVAKKRGVKKFSTYATWWIYQCVRRKACRHRSGFSRSVELDDLSYMVLRTQSELANGLNRKPTPAEISMSCNVRLSAVMAILETPAMVQLDDRNPGTDGEKENHEAIADPQPSVHETAENAVLIEGFMNTLECENPRYARIMRMLYGLPPYNRVHTLGDVARAEGVTRQRVQQIQQAALEIMRT